MSRYNWEGVRSQTSDPWADIRLHTNASLDQSAWAFYDDGTESGATIIGTENTAQTLDVDTVYQVRIQVDDTASGVENNVNLQLQRRLNGGAWGNVDATSTVAQTAASQLVEDGDTTARLSAPSGGSFITPNSGQDEDNGLAGENNDIDFVEGTHDYVEAVYSFQILSGDVADEDTVEFRAVRADGTVLEGYTAGVASATVNEAAGGQTLTGSLFTATPAFNAGTVSATATLSGALFVATPTFNTGTVDATATVTGSLFTSTPTFPAGTLSTEGGAQTLTGSLFTASPTFPTGTVDASYTLTGTLFVAAPTFNAGAVSATVGLTGSLFTATPAFPTGTVSAGGVQTLTGAPFQTSPTFPTGTVDNPKDLGLIVVPVLLRRDPDGRVYIQVAVPEDDPEYLRLVGRGPDGRIYETIA